jgi:hypothetical protein
LERQALRLPKATGITRDITIGITVRTMIGIPAPTTGRTIGSTGIGGTAGTTANTMDLIGERTMTGIAGRIIAIIDDNDAHTVQSMASAAFFCCYSTAARLADLMNSTECRSNFYVRPYPPDLRREAKLLARGALIAL